MDSALPGKARHAPATQRNRAAILETLDGIFKTPCDILEIASGSGEHGLYFSQQRPGWRWHPSDYDPSAIESIEAWRAAHESAMQKPEMIDVCSPAPQAARQETDQVDHMFCANMIHIAPQSATAGLFKTAANRLKTGGFLVLYGPFMMGGRHTSSSNATFDESLKARNTDWGIRDLGDVVESARQNQLIHVKTYPMPANNYCIQFRKSSKTPHRL